MVLKYKDEDLIGKRFGKLVIYELFYKKENSGQNRKWCKCHCDCGNDTEVSVGNITLNKVKSCGCRRIKYKDKDLIGKRFGKLVVLSIDYKLNKRNYRCKIARCKCDCGNDKDVRIYELLRGDTTSCGCYHKEQLINRIKTHSLTGHPLYTLWCSMIGRCENPNNKSYVNYGGRGIKICKDWRLHPEKFINWCLKNGWEKSLSIDRINNDGDYEPSNCRFTNQHIQSVNQRVRKDNPSGYKGITYDSRYLIWKSEIKVNKVSYFLGQFKSKREALEARNRFIIENGLTEYKIQEWKGE